MIEMPPTGSLALPKELLQQIEWQAEEAYTEAA